MSKTSIVYIKLINTSTILILWGFLAQEKKILKLTYIKKILKLLLFPSN